MSSLSWSASRLLEALVLAADVIKGWVPLHRDPEVYTTEVNPTFALVRIGRFCHRERFRNKLRLYNRLNAALTIPGMTGVNFR